MNKEIGFLNGKIVSVISSGDGVGSTFVLVFGEDDFSLSVYCSWRLVQKETIITTSLESNLKNIPDGLNKLQNKILETIFVNSFNDIQLKFNDAYILDVFCDITPNIEDYFDENWYILNNITNTTYSALSNGEFEASNF